jgi:polynucleotide 5'-hydroxyl-kinase GRC3/NOL9
MERPIDIPPAWEWSADQIVQHRWRKVLVLGAVDRGKSTYCGFLSQRCLAAGLRVAVVDTDIGQKDIGPPATLTLGYPEATQSLAQVPPVAWYFIGTTSPTGHLLPMIVGLRHLLDCARAACIIMNTTGFIHGPGRVLKGYKIEAVQPDVIVALEHGRELRALLQAYRHYRILRLPPSAHATTKTPEQRRAARERAFGAYFAAAPTVELALRRVIFQRSLLFTGRQLEYAACLYAEHTPEGVLAIAAGEGPDGPAPTQSRQRPDGPAPTQSHQPADLPNARVLPAGFEHHLLCGVAGRRNEGLGLARVLHIDFARQTIALHTPVPVARIKVLQFGALYVDATGCELGHRVPRDLFG